MGPDQEPVRDGYQAEPRAEQYIPPPDELRQRHSIQIEFLSIGCIVRIGCKSIAFSDIDNAMCEVNAYVKDPVEAYKKWSKVLGVQM